MVKRLTYLIEFFHFFPILTEFAFIVETFVSKFPNLHFVVLSVEQLTLCLFQLYPQYLYFA